MLDFLTWQSRALRIAICEKHWNAHAHTHTGLLFIFANKQQKQIGQTPQFKHEHFSKRGGDWREIQERFSIHSDIRAWRYTQHSYRTDGSTGNEVIAPNLADLVRGQISDQHRTARNLGQFHAASAHRELPQGPAGSRANLQQHLDPKGLSYMEDERQADQHSELLRARGRTE